MSETRKKKSGAFVWAVMGFLILGLGGFGLTGAFQTTGGSTVAAVGNEEISADEYLRGFQQDINRASAQFGQHLSMQQAQLFGIDQTSLRRQVTLAALTNEAARLNLSVGDDAVREAIRANPAFQAAGTFSRAAYEITLNQQNTSQARYESLIRADQTQNLISNAISGAIGEQATAARALLDFVGEKRNLTWIEINADNVQGAIESVDEATALAFYTESPDLFTIPETRKITYAVISPEILSKGLEIDDADVRNAFEARQASLNTPARRMIDRIVFGSEEDAAAAMARITAGETSFEEIAAERGLSADEINIGLVRATQLSNAAAALLFGVEENGVYGPVEATLGPALFKVNAVIAENIVTYESVEENLRKELALAQAQSLLLAKIGNIEDLLAGGATLEELAAETDMELHTYDLNALSEVENSIDEAFYAEGYAAEVGEDRDLVDLGDSEIISLRVDEIAPPRLLAFDEVREEATRLATEMANAKAARAYAEELKAQIDAGADFSATISAMGEVVSVETDITRTSPLAALPDDVNEAMFNLSEGETGTFQSAEGAYVIKIDSLSAFDALSENGAAFLAQVETQLQDDIANDLYILFANGVVSSSEITINQGMIDQILANVTH